MHRRTVLLVSTILLVGAAWPSRAQQASPPSGTASAAVRAKTCEESFSRSPTEEFNKKCIALAGPLAAMRDNTLVIRMDDGSRKTYTTTTDAIDVGAFGYGLADFYPSLHLFVVCNHRVDDGVCTAVDGRTGRELEFGSAFPHFSPTGRWALAEEYGEEEIDNVVVHDTSGKQPVKVWSSKENKIQLPAKTKFAGWVDDKTVKLTNADGKPMSIVQAADGRWRISKTPR
ncbi:hypothetical protein [Bradyrhizobium sp. HKCCYLS20291]|uniref:hypothetical protein n=1 Tax=Bradyrhizobium sp. HKCCYLS20291 TaxID=3420766 RepID=UPI003EBF31AF